MNRMFSAYPGGTPGAGLVLLRAAVILPLIDRIAGVEPARDIFALGIAVTVLAIGLGAHARLAALLAGMLLAPSAWTNPQLLLDQLLALGALAMLGPGAFSIDALRFGRRRIDLGG